ncbi:MAG: DIP1984 family protein [Bacteroidales bacterium]|nr:DIP1984 family protein [Bacteroidales bacterium]
MKVYQALKEKKKLVAAINQLSELIKSNNSIQIENEFEFNVNELLQERKEKVSELLHLKMRLHKTAMQVQILIFELSELKQELKMYREIDTQQGVVNPNYSDLQITKKVQLSKADVLKLIENTNRRIDELQNKIDEFNYTHDLV